MILDEELMMELVGTKKVRYRAIFITIANGDTLYLEKLNRAILEDYIQLH
jgi:hypothetical protein